MKPVYDNPVEPFPGRSIAAGLQAEHQSKSIDINQVLKDLVEKGVDRYNCVEFRYIETLASRLPELSGFVAAHIEQKIWMALTDYQLDFERNKSEAVAIANEVSEKFPHLTEKINALLLVNDFKAVQRVHARQIKQQSSPLVHKDSLSKVCNSLKQRSSAFYEQTDENSLEGLMHEQEVNTLSSMQADLIDRVQPNQLAELPSVRAIRQSLGKINIDKLIHQALQDIPDNPGPLNQQMLVVRTLSTMGDLSPQYLNRFVGFMETLLWLEKAGRKSDAAERKKPIKKLNRKTSSRSR